MVRSHNVYTSSALLEAWYRFTRRERFMMISYLQKQYNVFGPACKITFFVSKLGLYIQIVLLTKSIVTRAMGDRRTVRRTDMTKLIWTLSDHIKTPRSFRLNPQTASSRRNVCGYDKRYYCEISPKWAPELSLCSIVTVVTYCSFFVKSYLLAYSFGIKFHKHNLVKPTGHVMHQQV